MTKTLQKNDNVSQENIVSQASSKSKKSKLLVAIAIAVILILTALFFAKGLFVVAIVNGSPISRLSLINELEKQGGKQTLQSIIDKMLIEAELTNQKVSITPAEIDEEIKKIESQIAGQGGSLEVALTQQGLTREKLREQISIQKRIEKVLADKVTVSDKEIDAYIKDSREATPADVKIEDFRKQISEQLKQQKLQQEGQRWVSDLTKSAKIQYFVNY